MTSHTENYRFRTAKGTEVAIATTATCGVEEVTREVWADGPRVAVVESRPVQTLETEMHVNGKTIRYEGCIGPAPGLPVAAILGNREVGMVGVPTEDIAKAIRAAVAKAEAAAESDADWQQWADAEAKRNEELEHYEFAHKAVSRAMK